MNRFSVPILCYHRIAQLPPEDELREHSVTPHAFVRQMQGLKERGYETLPLADLADAGPWPHRRYFVITFDDGYLDTYEEAFPVLQHYGFQATVFLVSNWLGANGQRAPVPAPMLSVAHVQEMSHRGIDFGAHSRSHPRLTELSPDQLWTEIAGCRQALEATLEQPVTMFAYPYGLFDQAVREVVKASGYRLAVAVENGHDDLLSLTRFTIGFQDDPQMAFRRLHGLSGRLRRYWRSLKLARPRCEEQHHA